MKSLSSKGSFFLILSFCLPFLVLGQYTFPEDDFVFDDKSIPRIDITIHPDSLEQILNPFSAESNYEYFAQFKFTREDQVEIVDTVGFRLRGNTSRNSAKKSFKVSFNSIIKGQKFYGLEKMNLNGEHNDPSIIRSNVCWDLYREAGIPCPRSNPVLFYINDSFKGIYINVEHIDEEFVEKRFTNNGGNLFKCLYPADLKFKGTNPELYKEEFYGRRAYDLKTNKENDDYSQLANFIHILNNTQGESFICQLESIFDVENYLKAIAMDVLVSNWDGPIPNKNNFYLYFNPDTERFTYLPYDLDNTFGIDFFQVDWANSEIYDWSSYSFDDKVPIYENILRVQQYKDKLNLYFKTFIEQYFNNEKLDPYLNDIRNRLIPYREQDLYAALDYGFTTTDFIESYNAAFGDHVTYGLKEYIEIRSNTALSQTYDSHEPLPIYIYRDYTLEVDKISFRLLFDSLVTTNNVNLHFQIDDGAWESILMTEINNGFWQTDIERPSVGNLNYYFEAANSSNESRTWPNCDFDQLNLTPPVIPNLVINEFLASNENKQTDEANEHEDWIEIFNGEDTTISLQNYFISDDSSNPTKWSFPDVAIPSNSYLTLWADEDQEQGDLHCNFKLSKNGEYLGLYLDSNLEPLVVDSLTFSAQETDLSFGRIPNGTGDFQTLDYTTFGYNNEDLSNVDILNSELKSNIFPNPSNNELSIELNNSCSSLQITINDLAGVRLYNETFHNKNFCILSLNEILASNKAGMYFLKIKCDKQITENRKFVFIN